MRVGRHRVEHGDCTGVSFARDCLTGCPDQDCAVDARQPTYGGAELVSGSGHPGRVSSALDHRYGLVSRCTLRTAAMLARPYSGTVRAAPALESCPDVLAGCTDHEAILVAELRGSAG